MPSNYLNQCWIIVNWTHGNKPQWKLNQNLYIFIQENAFENVVWKMALILSQPQCVKSLSACPCNNSGPVQAKITKFAPKMQKTLVKQPKVRLCISHVKVPIVLWTDRPWPSRSNLTWKSKFTPFWACPRHNSPPIQARITKFGPEAQNTLVKIPIVLGDNWPWTSRSNLT